jgi:nitrite reductase/ring-hydroxylating ferredoxin subunit
MRQYIADARDIKEGSLHRHTANDLRLLVGKAQGQYFAVEDLCPHAMVTFGPATLSGYRLTCPWHGFRFDVFTGDCADWPQLEKLHRFHIVVENNQLFLAGDRQGFIETKEDSDLE